MKVILTTSVPQHCGVSLRPEPGETMDTMMSDDDSMTTMTERSFVCGERTGSRTVTATGFCHVGDRN